jgi:hypothetical protein
MPLEALVAGHVTGAAGELAGRGGAEDPCPLGLMAVSGAAAQAGARDPEATGVSDSAAVETPREGAGAGDPGQIDGTAHAMETPRLSMQGQG